jgi:hypothetical protein
MSEDQSEAQNKDYFKNNFDSSLFFLIYSFELYIF